MRSEEACRAKSSYRSQTGAQTYADHFRRMYGLRLRPYRCKHCPHYHLTSVK